MRRGASVLAIPSWGAPFWSSCLISLVTDHHHHGSIISALLRDSGLQQPQPGITHLRDQWPGSGAGGQCGESLSPGNSEVCSQDHAGNKHSLKASANWNVLCLGAEWKRNMFDYELCWGDWRGDTGRSGVGWLGETSSVYWNHAGGCRLLLIHVLWKILAGGNSQGGFIKRF